MKRNKLVLFLVFIMIIGLVGCEKKVDTTFQSKVETQTSNIDIMDNKYQNQEKSVEEKVSEEVTNIPLKMVQPNNTKIVNDEINKQENKTSNEFKEYLGYWQLNNRDIKYNDVIRGFSVPLEIVSINDNILCGSLSFRMTDNYHINPTCTIKFQNEIKDNRVYLNFEDRVFGSGYGVIALNDETIEVEIKLKEINDNAPFSIEGKGVYKKISDENLNITTVPKNLFSYLEFSKKEMISELGKDYKIVTINDSGFENIGCFYPKYGVTFVFEDDEGNYVSCITCNETVEINGAKSKMNFDQIQQYLGNQDVMEIIDERIPGKELKTYELFYKIYDTIIRFDSLSEDGKDSMLSISKS